jgi:hypothetical protein
MPGPFPVPPSPSEMHQRTDLGFRVNKSGTTAMERDWDVQMGRGEGGGTSRSRVSPLP